MLKKIVTALLAISFAGCVSTKQYKRDMKTADINCAQSRDAAIVTGREQMREFMFSGIAKAKPKDLMELWRDVRSKYAVETSSGDYHELASVAQEAEAALMPKKEKSKNANKK